jgi:hypothetical protein
MVLLPDERKDRYGIEAHDQPPRLKREVALYQRWCAEDINTERGVDYAGAVQSTTLEKMPCIIRGFLGYAALVCALTPEQVGLELYTDPHMLARFLGYLKARGVMRAQMNKHIAVAKKVNVFLSAGEEEGSPARMHAGRMAVWLATLEAQISASMPASVKGPMPDAPSMYR